MAKSREQAVRKRKPRVREQVATLAPLRLAAIVESSDDAIIGKDMNGIISEWNNGAERLYGYSAGEAIGKPISILMPPDRVDDFAEIMRKIEHGDIVKHFETVRQKKDGTRIDVSLTVSPVIDTEGRIVGASTIARDISERKHQEAILRESEERFRLMADFTPALIWMSGTNKLCTYFNKTWLDFTGRSLNQERGNGSAEGVHPDDLQRCLDIYTQAFDRREEFRMEYRLRRHDGEYRWIFDVGVPRFNADHSFAGYIGSCVDVTERRCAEKTVRESEERFRLAAQSGKMFAYEWDAATDVIVRSGDSAQILGIDEATPLTGQQALAKIHPDDREGLLAAMAGLSPEKPYLQVSYRMVRPDGTVIWVERNSRAHFGKQGRMLRIVGMVTDITERKLVEKELAQAHDRLRLAMEAGKSVGWDRDVKTGRDTLFGDLKSMFGMPSEVHDGSVEDFRRYLHPEDRAWVLEAIDDAMKSKKPYVAEFRILWPDGTVRWVGAKGKFYYSPKGEPERMLGMSVDITERKLAEEGLRESEERLRLAAQVGKMYAYDWDVTTDVVIRSEESTRVFGSIGKPVSLTHQEFLANVHPEDRATFINSTAERTPESPDTHITYRLLRPDGSVFWMERTGHVFFDQEGRMVRMIGMVADITERKLAEEALSKVGGRLIEAHEEERTRIARELHDDIGQQLALLANNLALMEQDPPDSVAEIRNRTHEHLKRVHEIASDTQTMSHQLHSSKLQLLGIVAAAKTFCQELSEQHKVEIDFAHADISPAVPEEISLCLFRVMQEALQNAVKHSGVRHFEVELRGATDGIDLTVRDAGLGFDPEGVKNNRGLGLVSMQERVNLVKGTFSIDSRPGRGATIHVRLPLSKRGESARAAGGQPLSLGMNG